MGLALPEGRDGLLPPVLLLRDPARARVPASHPGASVARGPRQVTSTRSPLPGHVLSPYTRGRGPGGAGLGPLRLKDSSPPPPTPPSSLRLFCVSDLPLPCSFLLFKIFTFLQKLW